MELLFKCALLILTIFRQTHETFLTPTVESDQFEEMTEQVGTLLSDCTRLQVNNIAVVSDSEATIKWTRKSRERISLLNLKIVKPRNPFSLNITRHEKFHTFIIITSSVDNLAHLILRLKNTTLWNPSALYVLFDNGTIENGCQSVEGFLQIAWRYILVSSTVFCVDPVNGVMAYTYNPFSDWAPKSWAQVTFNTQLRNVFETKVIPDVTTCRDFTFDKTRNVNDYDVVWFIDIRKGESESVPRFQFDDLIDINIFFALWKKWNDIGDIRLISDSMILQEELAKTVIVTPHFIHETQQLTTTYPNRNIGFAILTRFPAYTSPYEKILQYMNPLIIFGILLISLATGIILGKCTGQGATSGSLEILRIMLGGSMTRLPNTNPLKIHMITILLLFMLSTSTFHGNLSSLLTAPIMNPLIDSEEDLKQSGFPIYIFHDHKSKITDDVLYSRLRPSDSWDCSEFVEKFEDVACLAERHLLTRSAYEKQLYLSTDNINNLYAAYVVPPDWPLTDAMNRMLLMINDVGLANFFSDTIKQDSAYNVKWQRLKASATGIDYRNLNLRNLALAFYILAFGYAISIVVFIGEVLARRLSERRVDLSLLL